jgi:hypothetical protein
VPLADTLVAGNAISSRPDYKAVISAMRTELEALTPVRSALDRARLRQASRLFADKDREFTPDDLSTIAEPDIRASRVFQLAADPKPT